MDPLSLRPKRQKVNISELRPKALETNDRGGGVRTTPLVTRKCGSTSIINGITAFEPGSAIGLHKHNCEESVMVLDGNAIAEIDGVCRELGPNDTTWIPANTPHRFINASESEPYADFLDLLLDRGDPHNDCDRR